MDSTDQEGFDTLAKRLKHARKNVAGISQGELAEKLGVQQAYISQLETGIKKTSTYTVTLAEVLGVSIRWLAAGKGAIMAPDVREIFDDKFAKLKLAAEKYSLTDDELAKVEEIALKAMQEIFLAR